MSTDDKKKNSLHEFIEAALAAMNPTASKEKLEAIKALAVAQIKLNEKREAELKNELSAKQPRTSYYIDSYISYGPMDGTSAGSTPTTPGNVVGAPNGTFGGFYTTYSPATSIYAKCAITNVSGDVYVHAKKGASAGTTNYALIFRSNNWTDWYYVGYTLVSAANSASPGRYWVGTTPGQEWIAVGTASMSSTTSPSNVLVDAVEIST